MKDFQFLDYHTEYSCKGEFEKKMDVEICFSFIFNRISGRNVSEEYEVILYKGTDFSRERHNANSCLFTKKQIRNHLRQAQGIYPFDFYIREVPDWRGGYSVFKVRLKLTNVPGTFHKYLLIWLRYMYEYPYNVILYDAYKLKQDPCFRFTSMSDLFNLVLSCFSEDPRDIHQIARNQVSKAMRKRDIREKLKNIRKLNNVYGKLKKKVNNNQIPGEDGGLTTTDFEFWESDDIFERRRKPVYMNVYKEVIKKK
jgi:hypothetical protein